jgi:hypothetical protein
VVFFHLWTRVCMFSLSHWHRAFYSASSSMKCCLQRGSFRWKTDGMSGLWAQQHCISKFCYYLNGTCTCVWPRFHNISLCSLPPVSVSTLILLIVAHYSHPQLLHHTLWVNVNLHKSASHLKQPETLCVFIAWRVLQYLSFFNTSLLHWCSGYSHKR